MSITNIKGDRKGENMNRLKELRKAKKLTQSALAKICNVTQGMVSGWEVGIYDIDNETLGFLANYFGVSIDYLLGVNEERNKEMPLDLKNILENRAQVTLNGRLVTQEDKEKMLRILEALYYEAKEQNIKK